MSKHRFFVWTLAWLIGLPLASLALANTIGLGEHAAHLICLVLSALLPFIVIALSLKNEGYIHAAIRLLPLGAASIFSVLVLGAPKSWIITLWFITLLGTWFGATRILILFRIKPEIRALLLGVCNVLLISTPFWSSGLLNATQGTTRTTLANWLVDANPVLTASFLAFDYDLLSAPLMYMQRLALLAEYHSRFAYANISEVVILSTTFVLVSAIGTYVCGETH